MSPKFERKSTSQFEQNPVATTDLNLDPALMDPEMSNYFFGTQDSHNPPPYSEVDIPEHSPTDWLSQFDDPFNDFIAQPFSSEPVIDTIDPYLFSHAMPIITSSPPTLFPEAAAPRVSPAMMHKPSPEAVS